MVWPFFPSGAPPPIWGQGFLPGARPRSVAAWPAELPALARLRLRLGFWLGWLGSAFGLGLWFAWILAWICFDFGLDCGLDFGLILDLA